MSSKSEYQKIEEYQNRLRKLNELKDLGIEPYPHKYNPTHTTRLLKETYQDKEIGKSDDASEGKTPKASVAGRLVLFRAMGKNAFGHIEDESGRIQVMFNRDVTQVTGYEPQDETSIKPHKLIEKKIDLGDILGVEGHLFHTNKGELTLFVHKTTLLCKTLLPLADKHSGLGDKEIRYRKRWLDLIANPDVRKTFRQRTQIQRMIRHFLDEKGFLNVETPILQTLYGGAEASPFKTKLNALDQEMFLRISLELSLKKLIVGGFPRVYEMGRVFRNEGIDRNHNPEFTLLEAYAAYMDYHDAMELVEQMIEKIAIELHGTTSLTYTNAKGEKATIDVKAPWKKLSLKESLKEYANIDVDQLDDETIVEMLVDSGEIAPEKIKKMNKRGMLIQALFEVKVEDKLIQPHHIYDYPIETTPLCKPHRDPTLRKEGYVERFESYVLGQEICNAYSELNDPVLQRKLLEEQQERLKAGDDEANPLDEEFLEAIAQGMPPTAGIGIGIDRIVMLLTGQPSIRDVLFFPWMKPQK